jgi:hypothetical protein
VNNVSVSSQPQQQERKFPHAGFHVLRLDSPGKNVFSCGCGLYRPNGNEVSFHYCATHAAAPELLAALESIADYLNKYGYGHLEAISQVEQAWTAIAKAQQS